MPHPAQHEEKLLRHALADPGEIPVDRAAFAAQVGGCPECQAFAYRALADLPVLLAAAEIPAAAAARWGERSAGRLEALLADALAAPPAGDGEPGRLGAFLARLLLPRFPPAFGLALVLVLTVLVGVPLLRQPALGPAFARGQLQLVLEALPPGYGFLAVPPSPFWRGYSLELLADLETAGLRLEDAETVRGVLLRSVGEAGDGRSRALPGRLGCDGAEPGEGDRAECLHGATAYRLGRALAEGFSPDPLLSSGEAVALLAWAGPAGEALAGRGAASPGIEAAWAALVEELLRRR